MKFLENIFAMSVASKLKKIMKILFMVRENSKFSALFDVLFYFITLKMKCNLNFSP